MSAQTLADILKEEWRTGPDAIGRASAPDIAYVTVGALHRPVCLAIDIEGEGAAEVAKAIQALPELVAALRLIARDLTIPGMPFCTIDAACAVSAALAKVQS